eukprot:2488579-Pleurochrysis_carterae.AAC.1
MQAHASRACRSRTDGMSQSGSWRACIGRWVTISDHGQLGALGGIRHQSLAQLGAATRYVRRVG